MSLKTLFGWNITDSSGTDLPDIFPLAIIKDEFIKIDVVNIYSKILTDVVERTHGLDDKAQLSLWDNCVKSGATEGLITLLSKAMAGKEDLFLVYEKDVGVLRRATGLEQEQIKADYEARAKSDLGIFISFKNYSKSDMVKLYSGLEYCTVGSLNKSMNLSKAIQFKMSDLRAGTNLMDSGEVKNQAKVVAKSLGDGKDVLVDAKDMIETSSPDLTAVKEAIQFLNQKRSFYLGMPESYINGIQTGGMGTTGENDTKAIERGLKNYYFSIVKPVLESVFETKVSYKSQDFRQISQGLEALKTFSIVDEDLISTENKQSVINQLFDFDTEAGSDK